MVYYLRNVNIEYIYDEKGRKKSVIIPIEIWEKLIEKKKTKPKKKNVKKYRGIIKEKELERHLKELRNEWERI